MRSHAQAALGKVIAIARREFTVRVRSRTYLIATAILALSSAAVALAPVAIAYLGRDATRIGVHVTVPDLRADPVAVLDGLFNSGTRADTKRFTITLASDLDAARREVSAGTLTAVLDVERAANGDPVFTVYTRERATSSMAVLSRQAAISIATADRLARLGLSPADQSLLLAVPTVIVRPPDLADPALTPEAIAQAEADAAILFGLETFLLLAIVLYGTWVAQSVAEEKGTRMMEIVLTAATPFQLLAGKVLGVSAAALLQFAAVLATTVIGLVAQDQVAAQVLGSSEAVLPSGVTLPIAVAFTAFFLLGFLLYAALYATAGSLVSRQEDVTQVVQPMTLLACGGYIVALYASIGTLDSRSPFVIAVSWIPFTSPYAMLSRLASGEASPVEGVLALVILGAAAVLAAWIAARVYAAGVLSHGQKPSARALVSAARGG